MNTASKQKESKTQKGRLEEHEYTRLEEYRTEKSLVLFPNDYSYMARVRKGKMVNLQMGVKAKDFVKAHMSLYREGMHFPLVNKDPSLAALQLLLSCSSLRSYSFRENVLQV